MPSILSSALPTPSRAAVATQRGTQSASQSAPVFQFACLFTHDIRRKNTKRWQDGYLSYHSFNGRVMVYDESRNYIGDTYRKDVAVDDGDELTLAGVLVQVGERKATEQTDLTELLAKRQPKPLESERAGKPRIAQPLRQQSSNLQSQSLQPHTQRRWTGWAARAHIPTESPHALRQAEAAAQKENVIEEGPARKKQRQDDEHVPLWQILKTTKPARSQAGPGSMLPPSSRVAPATTKPNRSNVSSRKVAKPAGQSMFAVRQVIDITESSSDQAERPAEHIHASSEKEVVARDERDRLPALLNPGRDHPGSSHSRSDGLSYDPGGVYSSPLKPMQVPKPRPIVHAARTAQTESEETRQAVTTVAADRAQGITAVDEQVGNGRQIGNEAQAASKDISKHAKVSEAPNTAARPTEEVHSDSARPTVMLLNPAPAPAQRKAAPFTVSKAAKNSREPIAPHSSPSVCTSSVVCAAEAAASRSHNVDGEFEQRDKVAKPKQQQTKPLRLSSAAPRKMLMCQSMLVSKETAASSRAVSTDEDGTLSMEHRKRKPPKVKTSLSMSPKSATPQVIAIDDDDSELDFEVMKPKKRRREEAQKHRSSGPHRASPMTMPAGDTVSTGLGEGGLPFSTNQIDQRPGFMLVGTIAELASTTADAIVTSKVTTPARKGSGIAYGAARLDAEFLSPVRLTAVNSNTPILEKLPMRQEFNDLAAVPDALAKVPPQASEPLQPVLASKYNRPFRRIISDLSPIKKPAKPNGRTLRRAETMTIPQETRKQQQAKVEARQQEFKDTDMGPWSREAWDLFGGCPKDRPDRPIWAYDVLADVNIGSSILSPVAAEG